MPRRHSHEPTAIAEQTVRHACPGRAPQCQLHATDPRPAARPATTRRVLRTTGRTPARPANTCARPTPTRPHDLTSDQPYATRLRRRRNPPGPHAREHPRSNDEQPPRSATATLGVRQRALTTKPGPAVTIREYESDRASRTRQTRRPLNRAQPPRGSPQPQPRPLTPTPPYELVREGEPADRDNPGARCGPCRTMHVGHAPYGTVSGLCAKCRVPQVRRATEPCHGRPPARQPRSARPGGRTSRRGG